MRQIALTCVLLSAFAWAGGTTDPAPYTINVHVTKSRMVVRGTSSAHQQELNVVINSKKYQLESVNFPNTLLVLGDYKAKLVTREVEGTYDSFQIYEFLFPDRKTRRFLVVGQTE